jgi:hypothetical protein
MNKIMNNNYFKKIMHKIMNNNYFRQNLRVFSFLLLSKNWEEKYVRKFGDDFSRTTSCCFGRFNPWPYGVKARMTSCHWRLVSCTQKWLLTHEDPMTNIMESCIIFRTYDYILWVNFGIKTVHRLRWRIVSPFPKCKCWISK